MFWLILIGVLILVIVFWRIFKIPKCGNMVLITGGIKTGKSTLSVRMAYGILVHTVFFACDNVFIDVFSL